jgi:hypothetical protein
MKHQPEIILHPDGDSFADSLQFANDTPPRLLKTRASRTTGFG